MNVKLFNKIWPITKSYKIINNYVLLSHLLVIDNDDDPVNYLVNVLILLTLKLSVWTWWLWWVLAKKMQKYKSRSTLYIMTLLILR